MAVLQAGKPGFVRTPKGAIRLGNPLPAAVLAGLFLAVGCGPPSGVCDPVALAQAKSLVVLPAVGAPGEDGQNAGPMQAGVLITSLSNLKRFDVQGCAALRKAMRAAGAEAPPATTGPADRLWDCAFQADLAKRLKIDLLVVSELTDYRYTRQSKSASYMVGSTVWTESTFHAGVNVRLVSPRDGRIVYAAGGSACSGRGYGPAVLTATDEALKQLKEFLARQKEAAGPRS